jgi:hypothetical protein
MVGLPLRVSIFYKFVSFEFILKFFKSANSLIFALRKNPVRGFVKTNIYRQMFG